jgi:hypothetical protein
MMQGSMFMAMCCAELQANTVSYNYVPVHFGRLLITGHWLIDLVNLQLSATHMSPAPIW